MEINEWINDNKFKGKNIHIVKKSLKKIQDDLNHVDHIMIEMKNKTQNAWVKLLGLSLYLQNPYKNNNVSNIPMLHNNTQSIQHRIFYNLYYVNLLFNKKKYINMRSKCFLYSTGVIDESLQEIVSNIKEQNDEKKILEVNCLSFFSRKEGHGFHV